MIRRLNIIQTRDLLKMKESGMGYQLVEAVSAPFFELG